MFLLYYKNGCQYSRNAENLLSLYSLIYQKIIVDDNSVIRSSLLLKPYYHHTMPAIFFYFNEEVVWFSLELISSRFLEFQVVLEV